MHASFVVLSALVAVTAGQVFYSPYGIRPAHSISGQPLDTPEVAIAKARHAIQWNHEAARTAPHVVAPVVAAPAVYLRKRREAPVAETPATQTQETAETPKEKRNALIMPLTYSAYSAAYTSPLAYSAYSYYPYAAAPATYLFRKRRDVSAEETKAQESTENNKEKRQTLLAPYTSWTSPLAYSAYSPYAAIPYSTYSYTSPAFFSLRKRRDTSAASEEQAAPEQSENRDKRQVLIASYYPAAIPYTAAPVYRAAPLAYSYLG